jgi:acetyl-CoA carboxylase carboxyl transferase subunit beta
MGPAGYRKARRAIGIAAELALPVLTIVDTPGAEMSQAAEEGGLSFAIADCLATLVAAPVPTLAVLAGEGGSGGAIALLATDRVVCAEHASLEAIAPEGASAILYRSTERAAELAATQGGASWDLARFGIADVVVPEGAAGFPERLGAVVEAELRALTQADPAARLETRRRRYRQRP